MALNERENWYGKLSPKEREALEAYATCHSYKAVANKLRKSIRTVDNQLTSARAKMGVGSMAEAMFLLAERGGTSTDAEAKLPAIPPKSSSGRNTILATSAVACLLVLVAFLGYRVMRIASRGPTATSHEPVSVDMLVSQIKALL